MDNCGNFSKNTFGTGSQNAFGTGHNPFKGNPGNPNSDTTSASLPLFCPSERPSPAISKSIMSVERKSDVLSHLKEQCMDRIKSKRKSLLTQRRLHCIQNISKQKEQQQETAHESHIKVINKMAQDSKMIEDIIVNEIQQFADEDIEWYNNEYE